MTTAGGSPPPPPRWLFAALRWRHKNGAHCWVFVDVVAGFFFFSALVSFPHLRVILEDVCRDRCEKNSRWFCDPPQVLIVLISRDIVVPRAPSLSLTLQTGLLSACCGEASLSAPLMWGGERPFVSFPVFIFAPSG